MRTSWPGCASRFVLTALLVFLAGLAFFHLLSGVRGVNLCYLAGLLFQNPGDLAGVLA